MLPTSTVISSAAVLAGFGCCFGFGFLPGKIFFSADAASGFFFESVNSSAEGGADLAAADEIFSGRFASWCSADFSSPTREASGVGCLATSATAGVSGSVVLLLSPPWVFSSSWTFRAAASFFLASSFFCFFFSRFLCCLAFLFSSFAWTFEFE